MKNIFDYHFSKIENILKSHMQNPFPITHTIAQNSTDYLRVKIISGQIAPGEKLNEKKLRSHLNISSAPLREAFRNLQREYLIESIPRKGSFVTKVSIEHCIDIYRIREMIECNAVELLRDKQIRELPKVVTALEMARERFPLLSHDEQIKVISNPFPDFHIQLIEATGNIWLVRCFRMISSNLARYQHMTYDPGRLDKTQKEHKLVVDLISNGQYQKAKKLLRNHIREYQKFLMSVLNKKRVSKTFK